MVQIKVSLTILCKKVIKNNRKLDTFTHQIDFRIFFYMVLKSYRKKPMYKYINCCY